MRTNTNPRSLVFRIRLALAALLAMPSAFAAPPNDRFADAISLEGASGVTSGTNVGATREAGEPLVDGYDGGRSVWWRWTAPATEEVTFHTFGSDFDTILGVYTGSAVSSLELVAENDDSEEADALDSLVEFGAVAGMTYHIVVDGVNDALGAESGDILVTWLSGSGPPPNDRFSNRIRLEEPEGWILASNRRATREPDEPDHALSDGMNSVWWSWIAPGSGTGVLDTFGSSFDTVLAVYTGASLGGLVLVTENDDDESLEEGYDLTSAVRFRAIGGTEYQIAVDGYDGESGIVALAWSFFPEEENRFIRGDCDGDGIVNITDAVCALEWLFQGGAEPECAASANADGRGAVDITDPIYLLSHLFQGGPAPAAPFPECGAGKPESDAIIGCWLPPSPCR